MAGTVFLVGGGPGDPGLLTRRGFELLNACDCVVYDALIDPVLLRAARPDAELIYVGKRAGQHSLTQDEINALLLERSRAGSSVCRLKGGDPFVFGRGGEEALALSEAGLPFEIVPGVSSAIAAPAYAGIPVTHREIATSLAIVTGHTASEEAPPESLPRADTLVFLMGVRALPLIVARLLERGDDPTTPVALVRWGTRPEQQTVAGTLATIEAEVERAGLKAPALIVVGRVVELRERLRWFDSRPLWGRTVVVTRAREQASDLVLALQKRGARVLECPAIRVEPLEETSELDAALDALDAFDWIVLSSANGAHAFWRALRARGADARALAGRALAAIGPATAAALEQRGLHPDFVPATSISEEVAQGLINLGASRVLIVRALETRGVLEERLSAAGVQVTSAPVYRTVPDLENADEVRAGLEAGAIDWVTFSSSSTVRGFLDALGADFVRAHSASFRAAAIGPITARALAQAGFETHALAQRAEVDSLVEAIVSSTIVTPTRESTSALKAGTGLESDSV